MTIYAVEVVYRGIFQKSLSRNICRSIVLASRLEGKIGTAFGRYGDSPERNGIPAKYFAVVADDPVELEETLAQYEPTQVDVTITVDDTLCKGVESWGQPLQAPGRPQRSLTSHRYILEMIRQGDSEGAREAMEHHISVVEPFHPPTEISNGRRKKGGHMRSKQSVGEVAS